MSFVSGFITGSVIVGGALIGRYLTRNQRILKKELHRIKTDGVVRKPIHLPLSDGELIGELYHTPSILKKNPCIIVVHGFGCTHDDLTFEPFGPSLALAGYVVVAFDLRCHGKTTAGSFKKNGLHEMANMILDITSIIDYTVNLPMVDPNRIGIIGFSLGGSVALYQPINDPRIKKIVAACTANDCAELFLQARKNRPFTVPWLFYQVVSHVMHFNPEKLESLRTQISLAPLIDAKKDYSQKVYLVHCRDDQVVPFTNFEKNRQALHVTDDHVLVFDQGGHTFENMQNAVLAQVLKWFNQM